jgi:hypothetical protein
MSQENVEGRAGVGFAPRLPASGRGKACNPWQEVT